jgi:O-methyltransferase
MLGRLRAALSRAPAQPPPDDSVEGLSAADRRIVEQVLPYTITGVSRLQGLIDAVRYCVARELPGAFAECGVWRGGSVLAMVLTLQELGRSDRDLYLYDTFEGMTEPTERDVSSIDRPALEIWQEARARGERPFPEYFDPELFNERAVSELLLGTGYPAERLHFVRGPVEQTLPAQAPDRLALVRLDTDWYDSTRHEMEQLYPRLVPGGVLIVDDYGHWDGARQAVDEYFDGHPPAPLLHRLDYAARLAVKP